MERYRDFNHYLREIFGERVQKISLDAGLDCPNRDGTISKRGCIFCGPRGSGTGAFIDNGLSIDQQIVKAKGFINKRYKARKFLAYFQSFTNTYGSVPYLKSLYNRALSHKGIVGISIGTRPDCIDKDTVELISSYQSDYLVWLELGLQSAHDMTLRRINRGHDVGCFERSVLLAHEYGLNTCVHIILGLPGENRNMMLETAHFLSSLPVQGIKIHPLYVIKGTRLAEYYRQGKYRCLERENYIDLVVDVLEILPPNIVIQRVTGEPGPEKLLAPDWIRDKQWNIKDIQNQMEERDTWQGRMHRRSIATKRA